MANKFMYVCFGILALVAAFHLGARPAYCEDQAVQITTAPGYDGVPDWSPDGSQIAFTSDRSGNYDIWVIPAEGGTPTQITSNSTVESCPAWSCSGDWIAFQSNRDMYYHDNIWRMPTGGGAAGRVTCAPGGLQGNHRWPTWSPDDAWIAYGHNGGLTYDDIFVTPSDSGAVTQITYDPAYDSFPAWSPDGTSIAFTSHRGGKSDIWVIPAFGGTPTQVTDHPDGADAPAWSPDGRYLAFQSIIGQQDIWIIPSTGGPAGRITDHPADDMYPAWSPDGSRIAFTSARSGNDDIWVIELPSSGVAPEPESVSTWSQIKAEFAE